MAAAGSLTFVAGERSKAVAVQVVGDRTAETDETFALNLSAPVNATLARGAATATIVNDDKARDRIAPKLSRLQVAGRTLRFTLSERANTTIAIKHGARGVETIKRSLHAGRAAVRLPALAPGNYVATISARDAAGNIGRAKRTFRIG